MWLFAGNHALARILPQIYSENKEPIERSLSALIQLLHNGEPAEQNSLLQLCGLVAKDKPRVNRLLLSTRRWMISFCWINVLDLLAVCLTDTSLRTLV